MDKFDSSSFVAGIFVGLLLLVVFIIAFRIDEMASGLHTIWVPNCPEEDSCYPEYFHGEWYIFEGERNDR